MRGALLAPVILLDQTLLLLIDLFHLKTVSPQIDGCAATAESSRRPENAGTRPSSPAPPGKPAPHPVPTLSATIGIYKLAPAQFILSPGKPLSKIIMKQCFFNGACQMRIQKSLSLKGSSLYSHLIFPQCLSKDVGLDSEGRRAS